MQNLEQEIRSLYPSKKAFALDIGFNPDSIRNWGSKGVPVTRRAQVARFLELVRENRRLSDELEERREG